MHSSCSIKWPFTYAMPDQKADRIVRILQDNVFALLGLSTLIKVETLKATSYGDLWSHAAPYHPMGDGLVERMLHLPFLEHLRMKEMTGITYSCCYSSISLAAILTESPYEVLFGSNPHSPYIPTLREVTCADPDTYCTSLQHKLMKLRELVETNIVRSASDQDFYSCNPLEALTIGQ